MTLVTATVEDIHGGPDNSVWIFHSLLREASDGTGIVSPRPVRVTPIAGVLSITLDPGFSAVAYRGKEYVIEVPATGPADLWDLIAASVAFPPGTPPTLVAAAVMGYLASHPPTPAWANILDTPFVAPEDYGVVGNGSTDDRAALNTSNTAALAASLPVLILPGTYRIASNLTFTVPVWLSPGAVLKPDSGITISLNAGMQASFQKVFDMSAGGRARVNAPILYPEWWGGVGDGTTDNALVLDRLFNDNIVAYGGGTILLTKTYATTLPINIKSNTTVLGPGGLKCLAFHSAGGFLLYKSAIKNVTWDGPFVDINGWENMNGHCIGDVPNTTDFVSDIYIRGKVFRTRVMTGAGGESGNDVVGGGLPVLYAGGGKGLTVQFRARNVYCNITTEDCDIGASIEAAVSLTRHLENVVIDLQAKDCKRSAVFIGGSRETTSGDSGNFTNAKYPGVKIRVHAWGGQDGLVTDPVNTTQLVPVVDDPNYFNAGVVTLNWASGIDLELTAATPNRCTLIRGMAAYSTIKINNALMDNLQDVWDTRPIDTLDPAGVSMSDNVFEANVHAKTHYGVVVRPHRDAPSGNLTMQRTNIDIKMWCQDGVGAITQDDSGVTDSFGNSVAYRFRDMKASPVKDIVGLSSHNPKPQWALAASGGRVAAERESWHDGTREVAVFDATNGWQFPRMLYNEKPIIFGSGGAGRRWLHYDATSQVMRLAGSAPVAETSGQVIATQGSVIVPDGTTTPSAAGGISLLVTANTTPTTITNLLTAYTGQPVTIRFNDNFTTVSNGATIKLRGAVGRTFTTNSTLTLASSGGAWYEIGHSDVGSVSADIVVDGTTNHTFTAADDTKLTGIATGATANDTDANLKARANHTGTQVAATISDFSTAADARITAAGPAQADQLSAGLATLPRWAVTSATQVLATGTMQLTYFTADKTQSVSGITVRTGGTAAVATPTLCRIGLFSVAVNGDITLIASTVNDTALFAAANTSYAKSFSASASVARGDRLAVGILVVSGAALPTMAGFAPSSIGSAELAIAPRLSGQVVSLSDLPSSEASASIANSSASIYSRIA